MTVFMFIKIMSPIRYFASQALLSDSRYLCSQSPPTMTNLTLMSHPVPEPIEIVYSEVDGITITMDVYIPETATKEKPVPVLLWWHGM